MFLVIIRDSDRRCGDDQAGAVLFLCELDAAFDLANILQVLRNAVAVAWTKLSLKAFHLRSDCIENASLPLHSVEAFGRVAAVAEQGIKDHARINFPRERRVLADHCGGHLIDRHARADVLTFSAPWTRTAQKYRGGASVIATAIAVSSPGVFMSKAAHDHHLVLDFLQWTENSGKFEIGSFRGWRPVAHHRPVGHV